MNDEEKIKKLTLDYLVSAVSEIKKTISQGKGKEILGEVINRPEDIEIGIDRIGEEILERLVREYNLNVTIFSEPEHRDITNGHTVDFYGSIDPFDGSVLFLKNLKHNWYTVLSFFDKERNPICTGVADILNEEFYLSDEQGNYLFDLKTNQKKQISPSQKKDLKGPVVLASYLMSPHYSAKFLEVFNDLIKNLDIKSLVYPQGGSFIYAYLAAGLVDAYVMFNEPRSEIDPGFAIAKKAGCPVVSVNPDGTFEDYRFVPGKQHDKVPLLIAACTSELRDELIRYYLNYNYVRK